MLENVELSNEYQYYLLLCHQCLEARKTDCYTFIIVINDDDDGG